MNFMMMRKMSKLIPEDQLESSIVILKKDSGSIVLSFPHLQDQKYHSILIQQQLKKKQIDRPNIIKLREIGRSRYLLMSIFNKYLIKIGNPFRLKKELKYPINTKQIRKLNIVSFLKFFEGQLLMAEFRFYFLEFLNSSFLKDQIAKHQENSKERKRLIGLLHLFLNFLKQDEILWAVQNALQQEKKQGDSFKKYTFVCYIYEESEKKKQIDNSYKK